MFSHIGLGVNDIDKSILFYDAVLGVLGYYRHSTSDTWAGYGKPEDECAKHDNTGADSLWINVPFNGEPATFANGSYIAILAQSREAVDNAYSQAISLDAVDEGKPGIRAEAHPNFYASYVRDPDGNKLCFVCHKSE